MLRNIFFDLDGTLVNSGLGIMNSLKFAYQTEGLAVPADSQLRKFIGPPLMESLAQYSRIPEHSELSTKLIADFQDYYGRQGWLELNLYPQITEMLAQLRQLGKQLFVATAKPENFARQILAELHLTDQFNGIYGADLSETMSKKEIIAQALTDNHLTAAETLMVGDRNTDVLGAKANQIATIGVLYGFGTAQELQQAGVIDLIEQPLDLVKKVQA